MKLRDIGEFGFIDRVAPLGAIRSSGVVQGIGDDCAVISDRGPDYLLVTTDLLVERVHFLMDWAPPEVIGAKALATNFSDIAAMGGTPLDAFVSLAIPERVEVEWLDGLYTGLTKLARSYDVNLLGGDTTGSKTDMVINIAVTGSVPRDQVLFRHTARPGDVVVLTGTTGESGAGCDILLGSLRLPPEIAAPLVRSHLEPRPHIAEGRFLASSGACTAAIDVSDGLSSDLGHLCTRSGLGALIYEEKIPLPSSLATAGRLARKDPMYWVLNGGEDYVLLAAVKPEMLETLLARAEIAGLRFIPIGHFVPDSGIKFVSKSGQERLLRPGGWNHFK